MKKIFITIFSSLFSLLLFAQSYSDFKHIDSENERLEALVHYIDSLNFLPTEENDKAEKLARETLPNISSSNYRYLSQFPFFLGYYIGFRNNDSSIAIYESSLANGRKSGNPKRVLYALQRLVYGYDVAGKKEKMDTLAAEIKAALDTAKNEKILGGIYQILAYYENVKGHYEAQLQYELKGLDMLWAAAKINMGDATVENIGVAYINISILERKLMQPDKAVQYALAARPYLRNYRKGLGEYYYTLVNGYSALGNMPKAQFYFDSLALKANEKEATPFEQSKYISATLIFAGQYMDENRLDSSFKMLKLADKIFKKCNDSLLLPQIETKYGAYYIKKKDYVNALLYLKKAESYGREMDIDIYANNLFRLGQANEGLGNWEEASKYYGLYIPLKDSLSNEAAKQVTANAEAKYQNKQKQEEINHQKEQLLFARKQRIALIAGLSLLSLVAGLLFTIYRNKKRTADTLSRLNKELNEANKTKAKLFSIISHDLGSPISQVYQFLKLQQLNTGVLTQIQKSELSAKIQSATGSLLETMEDLLLWSKTQMNEFNTQKTITTLLPLVENSLQLLQLNIDSKNIHVQNLVPALAEVNTDPYFLQTIFRNILQNAIKSSPHAGSIHIIYDEVNCSLQISNDGGSFNQQDYEAAIKDDYSNKSLSGLGLKLVAELAHKINIKVNFEQSSGNQTVCTILF